MVHGNGIINDNKKFNMWLDYRWGEPGQIHMDHMSIPVS